MTKVFECTSSMSWVSESCRVSAECQDQSISLGQLSITKTCWQWETTHPDSSCSQHHLWEVKLTTDNTHILSFIYSKVPSCTFDRPPHYGDFVVTILTTVLFFFFFFQVKKFAKYLDPNAHGRINFKDFCHGVFAIKGKRTVPLEQYFMPMPTLMNLFSLDQRVSSSDDEIKSYTAKVICLFSLVFQ